MDLDENTVRVPSFVPALPTRFRSKLMRCITRHAPLFAVSNRHSADSMAYEMEDPDGTSRRCCKGRVVVAAGVVFDSDAWIRFVFCFCVCVITFLALGGGDGLCGGV